MTTLKPLDVGFNVAVLQIVSRLFPCGFDVSDNAPDTFEKLQAHYQETGRILVWSGASEQTIFGDPEINYAFRAWHDWRHITESADFSPDGERTVCEKQKADIREIFDGAQADRFCALLEAEIIGQLAHEKRYGRFPENQRGFVVAWLDRGEHALVRAW